MEAAAMTAGPVRNLTAIAKAAMEFPHAMILGCKAINRPAKAKSHPQKKNTLEQKQHKTSKYAKPDFRSKLKAKRMPHHHHHTTVTLVSLSLIDNRTFIITTTTNPPIQIKNQNLAARKRIHKDNQPQTLS